MTVPQAFHLARQHHQAERLVEAEALYRQILAIQPQHAGALHLLGFLACQTGRNDLAVELIRQAVMLEPNDGAAWSTLGNAYRALNRHEEALAAYQRAVQFLPAQAEACHNLGVALATCGRPEEAIAAFHRALQVNPNLVEAHNNLGSALQDRGEFEEAVAAYHRALARKPDYAEAHNNLGLALTRLGRLDEAITSLRRALELQPQFSLAHYNLGNALRDQGQGEDAIAAYRRAIESQPAFVEAYNNLGILLKDRGRLDEAVTALRRAVELRPGFAEAHNNLGIALAERGEFQEAIAAFGRAIALQPAFADARNNAGNAFKMYGQYDAAVAAYRRVIELRPDFAEAWSNLGTAFRQQGDFAAALDAFRQSLVLAPSPLAQSNLILALHFDPQADAKTIAAEQRRWNEQFSEPVKIGIQPHRNDRRPDRRLKIGYVSPDFYDHVVGRNLLPLFRSHDHRGFEILCYSAVAQPDELTSCFRQCAHHWRSTLGVADEALAEVIRRDGVDILVDLAQHSAGNRLPLFARQPAPVQVSFAGYPESTGLEAIGYRISDRWMDECGTEETEGVFLLDSFWCYDPCGLEIEVNDLPATHGGQVTFGCLNNFSKINEPLLRLWSRVLQQLPNSRLLILAAAGSHRERTTKFLDAQGVARRQVEFIDPRSRRAYLELYHRLDIVLDTFPYNGHTTSLDALWMGMPVVSLAGERPVSRAGLSQLSNLGLPELVAHSTEEYVEIAARLAGDLPRLAELRRSLRPRMQASVLTDARRFARNIEAAYRAMWRQWCGQHSET